MKILLILILALISCADAGLMITPNNPVAVWVYDIELCENGTLLAWVDRDSMQFYEPEPGVIFLPRD